MMNFNPNPYNLPSNPAPGQMVAIPNETLLQMDEMDNSCNRLENLAPGLSSPVGLSDDIATEEINEIVDY